MLYAIFRQLVRLGTTQFFKEIVVTGAKPENNHPLIIAANHPNLAVDPFLLATLYSRPVYFLAKSTLFRNPILNWIFRSSHMIPVYRKQDVSDTKKNDEMFKDAAQVLLQGKAIAIFPEGTSREERQLLPLKTGAARLAFQTLTQAPTLPLAIQPVGITYLDPRTYHSTVTLSVGSLIDAKKYLTSYQVNPQKAVHDLTDEIEDVLKQLTVHIEDLEYQSLIEDITFLFGETGNIKDRMQQIADYVHAIAPAHAHSKDTIRAKLSFYRQMRQLFPTKPETTAAWFTFLMLLPGLLLNFVPYKLTNSGVQLLSKDPHAFASLKIGVGMFIYCIWYLGTALLLAASLQLSCFSFLPIFAALVILGLFAQRHFEYGWGVLLSRLWLGPAPLHFLTSFETELKAALLELTASNTTACETTQDNTQ